MARSLSTLLLYVLVCQQLSKAQFRNLPWVNGCNGVALIRSHAAMACPLTTVVHVRSFTASCCSSSSNEISSAQAHIEHSGSTTVGS